MIRHLKWLVICLVVCLFTVGTSSGYTQNNNRVSVTILPLTSCYNPLLCDPNVTMLSHTFDGNIAVRVPIVHNIPNVNSSLPTTSYSTPSIDTFSEEIPY